MVEMGTLITTSSVPLMPEVSLLSSFSVFAVSWLRVVISAPVSKIKWSVSMEVVTVAGMIKYLSYIRKGNVATTFELAPSWAETNAGRQISIKARYFFTLQIKRKKVQCI